MPTTGGQLESPMGGEGAGSRYEGKYNAQMGEDLVGVGVVGWGSFKLGKQICFYRETVCEYHRLCSSRKFPYIPHRRDFFQHLSTSLEIPVKLHTFRLIFFSLFFPHPPSPPPPASGNSCGVSMNIFWNCTIKLVSSISIFIYSVPKAWYKVVLRKPLVDAVLDTLLI